MTEYVLDVSKWRCGGDGKYSCGTGITRLSNKHGYSCCLGQFALQKGVHEETLMNVSDPEEVCIHINNIYDSAFAYEDDAGNYRNTELAKGLIDINDDAFTAKEYKIDRIRRLLEEHGHTLKVVNDNDKTNT